MNAPHALSLLLLPLLLTGPTLAALAAEEDLSAAEREAIESRIERLNQELDELQRRLREGGRAPLEGAPLTVQPQESATEQELEAAENLDEFEERRELESESERNPYAITTHRRNYLLPLSYSHDPNDDSFSSVSSDGNSDHVEVKFQFSAKFNLIEDLFGDYGGDLHFAYTQRSWWQAYNSDASSPFRETNYEPEVFIDFDPRWTLLGWTNINNRFSFNHLSNGRSGEQSRSWNRVILESTFRNDDWEVTLAPHWRVPESEGDDDNPDIERYLGYGDITVAHRLDEDREASLMVRGNPSAGNMGAQLDYSWPLFRNIRGHVQYYHGYGESMIDYDNDTQRLSVGFSLNPLFSGSD